MVKPRHAILFESVEKDWDAFLVRLDIHRGDEVLVAGG